MGVTLAPLLEPTNPVFSEHFRAFRVVWSKLVAVITIASVDHGLWSITLLAHNPWDTNILSLSHLCTPVDACFSTTLGNLRSSIQHRHKDQFLVHHTIQLLE